MLLLRTNEVTSDKLQELLGQMTSIDDLRIIFNLGFEALSSAKMHDVLAQAFDEAIREKLVFDDRADILFKMGLQECRRHAYISEMEQLEWDLKATKTQFSRLKDALTQREENLNKQRTRRRYISLLSSTLMMCGGAVIRDVFGAAFDLWDPEQLLDVLSVDYVADFITDMTREIVFKDGVEAFLTDLAVDPKEFALVLRDMVNIEQTMDVGNESLSFFTYTPELHQVNPLFPPEGCDSSNMDTVLVTTQYATEACAQGNTAANDSATATALEPLTNDFQMSEEEIGGDLEQFLELVQYIDEDDGDINEALHFTFTKYSAVFKVASWETSEATALVYASYLGYIEIVKWFLDRSDVVPTEKKFSTINRARSRSNMSIEVWTKTPTNCA